VHGQLSRYCLHCNLLRLLGDSEPRSKIITGLNMGEKSSAVRMVVLIAIMAQIGLYVPATAVRPSMLDSVLTRMGGTYISRK
jgi:DNA mismatch repair protein MSH3